MTMTSQAAGTVTRFDLSAGWGQVALLDGTLLAFGTPTGSVVWIDANGLSADWDDVEAAHSADVVQALAQEAARMGASGWQWAR